MTRIISVKIVWAAFFCMPIRSVLSFSHHGVKRPSPQIPAQKKCTTHLFAVSTPTQETPSGVRFNADSGGKIGTVTILLPSEGASDAVLSKFGEKSPVDAPPVLDAAKQLARKNTHFSMDLVDTEILLVPEESDNSMAQISTMLENVDVVIALGLQSNCDMKFVENLFERRRNRDAALRFRQCQFTVDCTKRLPVFVGPYDELFPPILAVFPWTTAATAERMKEQMEHLFLRRTTDDFSSAIMIFFNHFSGKEVDWVKHSIDATWEKGPVQNAEEFVSMISKCGDCIVRCVQDEKCKECLDKLTEIDTRDQVASYRTIVSYESDLLRDFSFCILQKNNIFGCDATIPELPKVPPKAEWRGRPLTRKDGRAILVGHLDDEFAPEGSQRLDLSWEVACGANVAYDQFPSQNQIFYESVNGKDMWYDPVFRVECLDGRNVWCKRHYKVRDGPSPGTFYFSVLDNGITSNEFWTIVDVADDLSWIVFHYAGAASAVGQRYLGGLLCTPNGSLPPKSELNKVWSAFDAAGIAPWDLYVVNNDPDAPGAVVAGPAPLDYYRKDVLAAKAKKKIANQ